MQLNKDVFVALAALAWVDGSVAPEEIEALMSAAMATGLSARDLDEVEAALQTPVPIERLASLRIEGDDRLFVYGVGVWLVQADGVVTDEESAAMKQLARTLGLSDEERSLAASAAVGLSSFEVDDAPPRRLSSVARMIATKPGLSALRWGGQWGAAPSPRGGHVGRCPTPRGGHVGRCPTPRARGPGLAAPGPLAALPAPLRASRDAPRSCGAPTAPTTTRVSTALLTHRLRRRGPVAMTTKDRGGAALPRCVPAASPLAPLRQAERGGDQTPPRRLSERGPGGEADPRRSQTRGAAGRRPFRATGPRREAVGRERGGYAGRPGGP